MRPRPACGMARGRGGGKARRLRCREPAGHGRGRYPPGGRPGRTLPGGWWRNQGACGRLARPVRRAALRRGCGRMSPLPAGILFRRSGKHNMPRNHRVEPVPLFWNAGTPGTCLPTPPGSTRRWPPRGSRAGSTQVGGARRGVRRKAEPGRPVAPKRRGRAARRCRAWRFVPGGPGLGGPGLGGSGLGDPGLGRSAARVISGSGTGGPAAWWPGACRLGGLGGPAAPTAQRPRRLSGSGAGRAGRRGSTGCSGRAGCPGARCRGPRSRRSCRPA